jgi:hypothetical protein
MKHTPVWLILFPPIYLLGSFAAHSQVILQDQSNPTILGTSQEPVIQLEAPAQNTNGGSTPSINTQTLSPTVREQVIVKEPLLKQPDQTVQDVRPSTTKPASNTLKPAGEISAAGKGQLQNEPGLKDLGSLSAASRLKTLSGSTSLLDNGGSGQLGGFGNTTGLPGGETDPSGFGKSAKPGTRSSSLPGLAGMPSLPGAAGSAGAAPKLPGLGGLGKSSSASLLPGGGLPTKGSALPGNSGAGFGVKTPKKKIPGNMSLGDPSNVFGSKSRTVTSAPGLGQGTQSASISDLSGGSSTIMAGGGTNKDPKTKTKTKTKTKPTSSKPPLPDFNKKPKPNTKPKPKKKTKFTKKELPVVKGIMRRIEKKMAKNQATDKEVKLYLKLSSMVAASEPKKKKPGKGVFESSKCNPNDPNCDMSTEEDKIALVKDAMKKGGGRAPGQGDDMKPVNEDDNNDGSTNIVLGSSVISRPDPNSQAAKSGGGRIVTDLEKTGNPGAETE